MFNRLGGNFMTRNRQNLFYVLACFQAWIALMTQASSTFDEPTSKAPGDVRVVIEVSIADVAQMVPSTPVVLFASGNLKSLGQWQPDGLRLEQSKDGFYRAEFSAAVGTEVEFKITAGSWAQVERDSKGRNIENRRFQVHSAADGEPQRIAVTVASLAALNRVRTSVTGKLVVHERFESKHLPNPRNVSVWLPPGYDSSGERYPVLFLHDGQNLFDAATSAFGVEWQADEIATKLIENKEIAPVIVVGIWNTAERITEYTVTKDNQLQRGGRGLEHIQWVADELKPFIDQTYRTRPEQESTWIGGSSLGGLISMHACLERPEVFGGCLSLSPSLGWDDESLFSILQSEDHWPSDVRLWFSMGTTEGRNSDSQAVNLSRARRLAELLARRKTSNAAFIRYCEFPEGTHDEKSWSTQFLDALKSLCSPSVSK